MSHDRGSAVEAPAGGGGGAPGPVSGTGGTVIDRAAAGLHPAYFALVMATGIVSLAASVQGFAAIARGLFWLNLVFFGALWALTFVRIVRHRARVIADLKDHNRSVGFFTAVPGACVLGSQALLIEGATGFAWALWIAGAALWLLLTYTIFTTLTVKATKPALGGRTQRRLARLDRGNTVGVGAGGSAGGDDPG
jgi:hypothetical protein